MILRRRKKIILSSLDIIHAAHIENINAHCSHVINPLVRKYIKSLPWQTYSRRWFVRIFAPCATKTNTLKQLNICFYNVLRQLICAMSSCYHFFWWLVASSILKLKGARKDGGLCGRLARSNTNGAIHRISASILEFLSSLLTCFLLPRIVLFLLIDRSILLFKSLEDCAKS